MFVLSDLVLGVFFYCSECTGRSHPLKPIHDGLLLLFSKPRTRVSPTASAGQETDARIQRDGDLFHQGWEEGILHVLEDTQGA